MELGEYISLMEKKGDYQGAFFYSDNGDKLHLRKTIHYGSSGHYSALRFEYLKNFFFLYILL